jgi:hypothetical protein
MRILVEFTNPDTGEQQEIKMDGPEMSTDELHDFVLVALGSIYGEKFTENFELKISEIASGTIH